MGVAGDTYLMESCKKSELKISQELRGEVGRQDSAVASLHDIHPSSSFHRFGGVHSAGSKGHLRCLRGPRHSLTLGPRLQAELHLCDR